MIFPSDGKIVERSQVLQRVADCKRVVFTNGCFDLLHVGHLQTLVQARAQGDHLVVGLNSDRSVSALKGPARPLVAQQERAQMLAALECVDTVVIFDEDNPLQLLGLIRPAVHVKGGDYTAEQLPETPLVRSWGGEVIIAPIVPSRSTSLLEKALHGAPDHHGQ